MPSIACSAVSVPYLYVKSRVFCVVCAHLNMYCGKARQRRYPVQSILWVFRSEFIFIVQATGDLTSFTAYRECMERIHLYIYGKSSLDDMRLHIGNTSLYLFATCVRRMSWMLLFLIVNWIFFRNLLTIGICRVVLCFFWGTFVLCLFAYFYDV